MSDTALELVSDLEDARIAAMCEQDAETLEGLLSEAMVYTPVSYTHLTLPTILLV